MAPRSRIVEIGDVTELRREDLAALAEPRAPIRTKTFRDTHHNLARMVAMGMRSADIVEQSGYSNQRLSTLMGDPSFQELIAGYRTVVNDSFKEQADAMHQLMVLSRGKAVRMLNDRLEEAEETGELPPVRELLGIIELTADRTGYGKRETKVNVNVDFASALEKALNRKNRQPVIEHQLKTVESLPPSAPSNAPSVSTERPRPSGIAVGAPFTRRV